MITLTEQDEPTGPAKKKMLEQMADALEDEVASLFRRAATFEEEELLLNRGIGERQTEINRLLLKLEGVRAERDRVMEKIGSISREAEAIREELFNDRSPESHAAESTSPRIPGEPFFRRVTSGDELHRF
jgi:chromosome segregation ATPase